MKYGLIGEKLGHSFSKEIHERIGNYNYELIELNKDEFDSFMMKRNFRAINVTIPYKKDVIKYLDYISLEAKKIDAVNTIINKDGKLYGYNTDYLGFKEMLNYFDIDVKDKNIMILGTGGTSNTSYHVVNDLECKNVVFVSRNKKENVITYDDISLHSKNIDVLINTTPVEMYPNNECEIITSLNDFTSLKAIVDVVYNPLNTNLVLKAKEKNIVCCTGLYMLISQAVFACELFLEKDIDKSIINSIYQEMIKEKENIVLIGMPSSGKSTIGKLLSDKLNRTFIDIDEMIVSKINMSIKDYFSKYGEQSFRNIEAEVIKNISKNNSIVISTGGGSILRKENVDALRRNGKIFFLDRSLDNLLFTDDRPLSSSKDDLEKLFNDRYHKYLSICDERIDSNISIDEVISQIEERRK